MSPRSFATATAVALLIVAGFLLHAQVTATTPAGGVVTCGSVWAPDNSDGKKHSHNAATWNGLNQLAGTGRYDPNQYIGYEAASSEALTTQGTWGWVLGGAGVVALAGALLVSTTGRREPDQAAS